MQQRTSFGIKIGLSRGHAASLARLRTPEKIQDYISALPVNFEPGGDTCLSVAEALRQKRAHCIEAAFIAACAFWINGEPPLLMDFQAKNDSDHVVALFRRGGCWGAISKSNHVWLRWRDPIYRSPRELAMSYFHEYVSDARKTLATYSAPFDLRRCDPKLWVSNKEQCWDVSTALDNSRHFMLITPKQRRALRPRDALELRAGQLLANKAPNKKKASDY